MARRRRIFVFDPENIHFGQVPRKIGKTLLTVLLSFLLTFTLAVLTYLAFTLIVRTDTERRLRREIRMYERLYPGLEEREQLLGDAIANLQHKDNEIYGLVFHAGAPDLDPMADRGALSMADSIPDTELVGYTRDKANSLLRRSEEVEAAFRRIFRTLSDSSSVLPPMILPIEDITYPQDQSFLQGLCVPRGAGPDRCARYARMRHGRRDGDEGGFVPHHRQHRRHPARRGL